jgi:hypothetical protein
MGAKFVGVRVYMYINIKCKIEADIKDEYIKLLLS